MLDWNRAVGNSSRYRTRRALGGLQSYEYGRDKEAWEGEEMDENGILDEVFTSSASAPTNGRKKSYREGLTQWTVGGDGGYSAVGKTSARLPAGIYSITADERRGVVYVPMDFKTDALMRLAGTPVNEIMSQIETFWERRKIFHSMGFLHKRGILLHGTAGCGKTSLIRLLADDVVQRDGVVFIMEHPTFSIKGLAVLRTVEPERPVVHVIEDIEDKIEEHDESEILALLDGQHQIDGVLQLATTNYPEKLEERIAQRPGRFDVILKMEPPNEEARRAYLGAIPNAGFVDGDLDRWVADTAGFGIAHLREMVAAVRCLGLDYGETLERMRQNKKKAPKREPGTGTVGFSAPAA
jgi:hypothetical protein